MGVDLVGMLDSVREAKAMNDPYSPENIMNQIANMPPTASPGFAGGWFEGAKEVSPPVPPVMQGGMSEGGAVPQSNDLPPEADALVQGFKPKKRSFLGLLGDMILLNQGHKGPFFADRVRRKNYERAFEGFTQDPMETIRRIGTFDPETAWKMYGQLADDKRADAQQDRLLGKDNDSRLKSISGLAGVALANPQHRSAAITQYNQRLVNWGLEQYTLPEDISDGELMSIYQGAAPFEKQERAKIQERNTDIRERNVNSQIERRDVQNRNDTTKVGQAQQRINQAQQRINIAQKKGQSVKGKSGQTYEVMDIKDSKGFVRRVVLDRKKGMAYSQGPEGTTSYVIKGSNLVPTGTESTESE